MIASIVLCVPECVLGGGLGQIVMRGLQCCLEDNSEDFAQTSVRSDGTDLRDLCCFLHDELERLTCMTKRER